MGGELSIYCFTVINLREEGLSVFCLVLQNQINIDLSPAPGQSKVEVPLGVPCRPALAPGRRGLKATGNHSGISNTK